MSYMMRFDLRGPAGTTPHAELYAAAVDMAAWAESRGAVAAALSEHHGSPDGYLPSPLIMAAAMASRTETLPVTIAASLFLFTDPVRLAEDMCVLDHLSGGRVSYILGLGYRAEECAMFGINMADRAALAEEHLDVLLRALSGEPFEHDGRTIHVTPAPLTPGGPSVSYGGKSVAAARRAGSHGLPFMAETNLPELEPAYRAACEAAGHEPGPIMLPDPEMPSVVFVADDVDAAWAEVGPYLMHDVLGYAAWHAPDTATASISQAKTAVALRAERRSHQILSVDEAVAHLRTAGFLPLHPLCGGLPPAIAWPYLERVVDKVLPAISA